MASPAQTAVKGQDINKCSLHQGKEILFFCEDCEELSCSECVSKRHKKHSLAELNEILPEIKQKLKCFEEIIELAKIPNVNKKIAEIDVDLSKNEKNFKNIIGKIEEQNETLKKELDKVTHMFINLCQDIEKQNRQLLINYRTELQALKDKLNCKLSECKCTLKSGTNVQIYYTTRNVSSDVKLPTKPEVQTSEFREGSFTLKKLKQLIGEVTTTERQAPVHSINAYRPLQWEVASESNYASNFITSLQSAPDNHIWSSSLGSTKLMLVNHDGITQTQIKLDRSIQDFSTHPTTENIWFCTQENDVGVIKAGKPSVMFKTEKSPECICVTSDDHVVLGFKRQVMMFTPNGKAIGSTPEGNYGVAHPFRICGCPVYKNFAVVDRDINNPKGKGSAVCIFDDTLDHIVTFRGKIPGHGKSSAKFDPVSICYSSSGELFIADASQNCVFLMSGRCEYLQTVYRNSTFIPGCICVQKDGRLWITFHDKRHFKILKNY